MRDVKNEQKKRKLRLKKEAIRTLTSTELEAVQGGGYKDTRCCTRTTQPP